MRRLRLLLQPSSKQPQLIQAPTTQRSVLSTQSSTYAAVVSTPPPPCGICRSFQHDLQIKYEDLRHGEGEGCLSCSLVLHAIEAFLPDFHLLARQLGSLHPEHNIDDLVFCWDAAGKAIFLSNQRSYRLYLCTDVESGPEEVLFSCHDTASGDTNTEASFSRIVSWIDACTGLHDSCDKAVATPLPRRVLDIGETDEARIRLHETQNELGKYACLSHCWGTGQPIVTTSETYATLVRGIQSVDLPLTFRDAVAIARKLSIRYLWIDCLCIIQDSPKDLEEACALMDVIFENAFLTIAATKSTGPEHGLFTRGHQNRKIKLVQFPRTSPWAKNNVYVRNFNHPPKDDQGSQHWETAGISKGVNAGWPLLTRAVSTPQTL